MLIFTGNNLNIRHQELNLEVEEAFKMNTTIKDLKFEEEKNDVDRLFRIKLASKHRDINYIIENLKSGDSLYISKILKFSWLYDNDYSKFICPEYLEENIFPYMSKKMKNKTITAISIYLRDADRSYIFYNYCISAKLNKLALKFLLYLKEATKIKLLRENNCLTNVILSNSNIREYLKHFVGDSFLVAETFMSVLTPGSSCELLFPLRYLYSNPENCAFYLDLLEKFYVNKPVYSREKQLKFGVKMSKDLMMKYKDRILNKPLVYLNVINETVLLKHTTSEDAKKFVAALLPETEVQFWRTNMYSDNRHLIDLVDPYERFEWFKSTYISKYGESIFEMHLEFYRKQYHINLMTANERQDWALRHIENKRELLGSGKDYIWYKYVTFEKGFAPLKKYINKNKDAKIRLHVLKIMAKIAQNQQDLQNLLTYFYERHVNESISHKFIFLDAIKYFHNIFDFDEGCWIAYDKILHSLDIYVHKIDNGGDVTGQRCLALFYHILNNVQLPKVIANFLDNGLPVSFTHCSDTASSLNKNQEDRIYEYILNFYMNKMNVILQYDIYNDEIKIELRKYIHYILSFMRFDCGKSKEDIPEIVSKYIHLDWKEFGKHSIFYEPNFPCTKVVKQEFLTTGKLIRALKSDTSHVLANLPLLKEAMVEITNFNHNVFLKKCRIYFADDLTKELICFYKTVLTQSRTCAKKSAVHAILQLTDEPDKLQFMAKYVPTSAKIDHVSRNYECLYIQEAICQFLCFTRPPVPIAYIMKYLKGDYLRFCLPIFDSFMVNLPQPLCLEFVNAILNAPVSMQKHGLRLANKVFNDKDFKKLIEFSWSRTKNITLRRRLYKALFDRVNEAVGEVQKELFNTLKEITLSLTEDDDDEIISLLSSCRLPSEYIGEYITISLQVIEKMPKNSKFMDVKMKLIGSLEKHVSTAPTSFVENLIEETFNSLFEDLETSLIPKCDLEQFSILFNTKLLLAAKYIVYMKNEECDNKKLKLLNYFIAKHIETWDVVIQDIHIRRKTFTNFIGMLKNKAYEFDVTSYKNVNIVFETILENMENFLPLHEIYETVWGLKLNIVNRKLIVDAKLRLDNAEDKVTVIKNTAKNFGREVGKLIQDYIQKGQYFSSMLRVVIGKVEYEAGLIVRCLDPEHAFRQSDICVLAIEEIIEIENFETYMFALELLPVNYQSHFVNEYKDIKSKLRAFDSTEIHCYMYYKMY